MTLRFVGFRSKQKKLEGNRTRLGKLKTEIVQNVGHKQVGQAVGAISCVHSIR